MRASVIANRDYRIAQSTTGSMAPFSSISGARSTPASTSPTIRAPTPTACAATSSNSFANSRFRSCAIPAAISSRPTIGKTGSARARSGRPGSISRGTRPSPTQVGVHEFARMVRIRRNGDDARHQSRFARARSRAQFRRIRQRPDRQRVGRPAQGERPRRTVRRQALVPRQRDGRAVAGRPQDGGRIWPPRQRGGEDAARLRPVARAHRLRLVELRYEDLSRVGAHRPRAHLRRGRSHLAAHVFRQSGEEHRRISRAQRQARRLYQHHRLDDRIRSRQQAQPQAGDDLLRRMERLVSFQRAGSRDPRRRQGLAACAAPARGHLQFRGRAPGRLHPQHLHPPLRRGEDRLHRATGERHRADHDRARRRGVAADDLLSLFLRLRLRARRSAPAQRQVARLRFRGRRQRSVSRHRRRSRRGKPHADVFRRQPARQRVARPRARPARVWQGQDRRITR